LFLRILSLLNLVTKSAISSSLSDIKQSSNWRSNFVSLFAHNASCNSKQQTFPISVTASKHLHLRPVFCQRAIQADNNRIVFFRPASKRLLLPITIRNPHPFPSFQLSPFTSVILQTVSIKVFSTRLNMMMPAIKTRIVMVTLMAM
jgi:hypothetical protein